MPRKNSYITVTDQFCGAGGSSQGAREAGLEVKLALNHWSRAIETHQANFPDTAHECTDISACDPRRYHSTDILITSPECTTHSPAGGNHHKALKKQMDLFSKNIIDPATERSRATMWDVPRFAEYHKYNIIIVENVVEAKTNWPLFPVWLTAMQTLGYNHKCVFLNSMHCFPTPQSRDRMYIVFWKKGNKAPDLDYKPVSHCGKCEKDVYAIQCWKKPDAKYGKYRKQYLYCCPTCSTVIEPYYYAAFNCIDWSDIGTRIGDRPKPLSDNTQRRALLGLDKYANEPGFVINDQQTTGIDFRVKGFGDHLSSITTNAGMKVVQLPYILDGNFDAKLSRISSVAEQMPTQTTLQKNGLFFPVIIRGDNTSSEGNVSSSIEEMRTQCTRQIMGVLTPPLIIENKGYSTARPATKPLATATTKPYCGILTTEAWNSFINYNYNGSDVTSHYTKPLGACTTKERHSLFTYQKPNLEDCYYRMLKPREIKLAMAFEREYIVTGSGKDQVKQLGNAVTPPAMKWLVNQCVKSLS